MKKFAKVLAIVLAIATLATCLCLTMTACNKDQAEGDVIKMIDIEITDEQYAFAAKEGNTEMVNAVNEILATYANDIEAIKTKYINAKDETEMEQYAITCAITSTNRANELVVATSADFPPFEQILGTNKFYGIDVEVAQFIAQKMNKTLVIKNSTDYDALLLDLEENDDFDYDLAMAAITKTADRDEFVDFTSTYFNTTQVVLVNADNKTFDGCDTKDAVLAKIESLNGFDAKCGAQAGTTGQWFICGGGEYDGYENLTYSPYTSPALAVQDMINGNINFVVVDKAVASALLLQFN